MRWNATNWPAAMVNLSEEVRAKAIDFANALLARGYGASRALSTGITMAREWRSGLLERRRGGAPFRVESTLHGWEISRAGSPDIHYRFGRRADALRRAQELARRRRTACVVLDEHGAVVERFDFGRAAADHTERTPQRADAHPTPAVAKAAPKAVATPKVDAPKAVATPKVDAPKVASTPKVASAPKAIATPTAQAAARDALAIGVGRLEVRKGDDGWVVTLGDATLDTRGTKRAALDAARERARAEGLSVAIYKASGELQKVEDHA
jgi:hypothetical protein